MGESTIRVGIIGAGANTRLRHIPGLSSQPGVEIVAVCNRRRESTEAAAAEFGIPKCVDRWPALIADPAIDAVVIGTWPSMHAPISIAALDAGKHVLSEARMARNLAEARAMREAAARHPNLVAQIVPSPFGFRADRTVKRLLAEGFLGALRQMHVYSLTDQFADPSAPLHWRENSKHSGLNVLALGILHETAMRWTSPVEQLTAVAQRSVPQRFDPEQGKLVNVEVPDSVHVLTTHADGMNGVYQFSGTALHGAGNGIWLYGSEGTLHYRIGDDRLFGGRRDDAALAEIDVSPAEAYAWRVEEEFIAAIRGRERVQFTDFSTGVAYMAFIEAVHQSIARRQAVAVEKA